MKYYCIRLYIWFLIKKLVQVDETIEDKNKGIIFRKITALNFIFNLLLLTFILEISRLQRQKSLAVELYNQKLNQIIDVERKLEVVEGVVEKKLDEINNKWHTPRK